MSFLDNALSILGKVLIGRYPWAARASLEFLRVSKKVEVETQHHHRQQPQLQLQPQLQPQHPKVSQFYLVNSKHYQDRLFMYYIGCDRTFNLTMETSSQNSEDFLYITKTSPGHPLLGGTGYPSSLNCRWTFNAPASKRINLTFESIDIERCNGASCACDDVSIFDGSKRLAKVCGTDGIYVVNNQRHSKLPAPIESTSNGLVMTFKTDSSEQRVGFKAWISLSGKLC